MTPEHPYPPHWQIAGIGNVVEHPSATLDNTNLKITGDNNRIILGQHVLLAGCNIVIAGDRHTVRIGDHVQLRNSWIWIEDSETVLDIGAHTSAEGASFAVTEPKSRITVGQDCMFSYGIDLRSGDSHSIVDVATGQRINYAEDITLGDHVWVGAHAHILKGAVIGEHSIVATAALVTRGRTPPNVILAGNPARVVKEGVTWKRERTPRPASPG